MSKKILSVVLTIAMIATLFCLGTAAVSASEDEVHAGDVVNYTFYINNFEKAGGVTAAAYFNTEYLAVRADESAHIFHIDGFKAINPGYGAGEVQWTATFGADGLTFVDEPVVTVVFDVVKDGTLADLGLTYDTVEFFGADMEFYSGNDYVYTTVSVEHNEDTATDSDTATDTATDSDTATDTATDSDTETDTTTDSDTATDTATDSDTETDTTTDSDTATDSDTTTDTTTDSDTDTSSVSSTTSSEKSTDSDSDSDAKNTNDNASSKNSSSSKAASSKASTTGGTVQTAGTIAVVSLVVILMAAAAVVLFAKKKAEQE